MVSRGDIAPAAAMQVDVKGRTKRQIVKRCGEIFMIFAGIQFPALCREYKQSVGMPRKPTAALKRTHSMCWRGDYHHSIGEREAHGVRRFIGALGLALSPPTSPLSPPSHGPVN